MITEQELELALQLMKEIKDLKIILAKFEESKVSRNTAMNCGISIDASKIEVDDYTQHLLQKFKDDIVNVHKIKLQELRASYSEIIESAEETLIRIVKENG